MTQHIRFICTHCKRPISGCLPSCPALEHKTEEVESCAVCKTRKGDE